MEGAVCSVVPCFSLFCFVSFIILFILFIIILYYC